MASETPVPPGGSTEDPTELRLDSWKEIAVYLKRDSRTVARWEKSEGLPVHRHQHGSGVSIYAYKDEIEAWLARRSTIVASESEAMPASKGQWWRLGLTAAVLGAALAVVLWRGVSTNGRVDAAGWLPRFGEVAPSAEGSADAPVAASRDAVLPFEKRNVVLIAAFDNKTGDESLDGTLEASLGRELANSSFVVVASKARIADALRLMARPEDARLEPEIAREVALRDGGIHAIVDGAVERVGSTYLLSADLVDPESGAAVASLSEEAASEDELVRALRRLSSGFRALLGEEIASIERTQRMLEKVTSPSLRAVQLYTEADDSVARRGPRQSEMAEALYRGAIEEDPTFASAYIMLAYSIANQAWNGRRDEAIAAATRAMELADSAPDREAYFIRASKYQFFNEGGQDTRRARANYEALLRLHPDHYWGNSNARGMARREGGLAAMIPYNVRKGLARPNDLDANYDAAHSLAMYVDKPEEARPFVERVVTLSEGSYPVEWTEKAVWAWLFEANESWVRGDAPVALEELDALTSRLSKTNLAETTWLESMLFWAYRGVGRPTRADDLVDEDAKPGLRAAALTAKAQDAFRRGDRDRALVFLTAEWPRRSGTAFLLGEPARITLLARCGAVEEAHRLFAAMELRDDLQGPFSPRREPVLNLLRAELALAEVRSAEAIEIFEGEALGDWVAEIGGDSEYVGAAFFSAAQALALAYEEEGRIEDAIAVLQEARLRKRRAHPYGREAWLGSQLELLRLYDEKGRAKEADEVERELRALMALAEPDFWLVRELEEREASSDSQASATTSANASPS